MGSAAMPLTLQCLWLFLFLEGEKMRVRSESGFGHDASSTGQLQELSLDPGFQDKQG